MGIRSLSTASISTGAKRSKIWDQSAVYSPTAYESIATVTVGAGGSGTITFSSIPGTYKHLQIRYFARDNAVSAGGDDMLLQFNGDSSANYSWHRLTGNGTVTNAGAGNSAVASTLSACAISRNGNAASIFSSGVIDILDYTNTNKNKTVRSLHGYDANGVGEVALGSGFFYANTNAITSLTFTPESSRTFLQYTHFALYGIKG